MKRIIATITFISYILTNCGLAYAQTPQYSATLMPSQKLTQLTHATHRLAINDSRIFLGSKEIGIAPDVGTVSDVSIGKTPEKCVVVIEDAHCNYSLQQNESRIVQYFENEHSFDSVYLEGAVDTVNTAIFSALPNTKGKQTVFDAVLKEGQITGVEHGTIMRTITMPLYGIENTDLYTKHVSAATKLLGLQEETLPVVAEVLAAYTALKNRLFSRVCGN